MICFCLLKLLITLTYFFFIILLFINDSHVITNTAKKIRTILCLVVGTVLFINIYLIISSFLRMYLLYEITTTTFWSLSHFNSNLSILFIFRRCLLSCLVFFPILILIDILLSAFHTFFFLVLLTLK